MTEDLVIDARNVGVRFRVDGGIIEAVRDVSFKLGKGQMTQEPVKTNFGYHIIRVDDIREAQLPKLDDVKPQIVQQLQQQKMAKFQQELRQSAKVE